MGLIVCSIKPIWKIGSNVYFPPNYLAIKASFLCTAPSQAPHKSLKFLFTNTFPSLSPTPLSPLCIHSLPPLPSPSPAPTSSCDCQLLLFSFPAEAEASLTFMCEKVGAFDKRKEDRRWVWNTLSLLMTVPITHIFPVVSSLSSSLFADVLIIITVCCYWGNTAAGKRFVTWHVLLVEDQQRLKEFLKFYVEKNTSVVQEVTENTHCRGVVA